MTSYACDSLGSNLTNKYNPQERAFAFTSMILCSNLTNKYNPQERFPVKNRNTFGSNLTNKYNPQEPCIIVNRKRGVQILPINTILKNHLLVCSTFP